MHCKVCTREIEIRKQHEYCDHHQKAYENLQQRFAAWQKASGIEWHDYLREVAKNPLTGVWVKEVAENLLSEKDVDSERNI